jgi:hypothetical protein
MGSTNEPVRSELRSEDDKPRMIAIQSRGGIQDASCLIVL